MSRQHRRFELNAKRVKISISLNLYLINIDGGSALEICVRGNKVSFSEHTRKIALKCENHDEIIYLEFFK